MIFPEINPTILKIGFLQIRWYSMMYIISFIIGYFSIKKMYKARNIQLKKDDFENLFFYIMLGVMVGGRVGYVLFYNLSECLHNPLEFFAVWHGGMSFHGGMLGVVLFGFIFSKKHGYDFYKLADPPAVIAPIALAFGRLGNFINAELYGRSTDLPWGMVFPTDPERIPRHPSQLYELFLEGILLFAILFFLYNKKVKEGIVFWSFISFYGLFRFLVEFVREPDVQLGHLIGFMTMGQILSSLMVIVGIVGIISCILKKQAKPEV
ncbi:MAG: prolipoprotein diacylglyceryl transferase [Candidatus Cloacimonadota bacterium]|nr:prolipoprotein diacylglyceryl transferase [Candidatus Cloacimonadota bacterium]